MERKKCVIFGAGGIGTELYQKLSKVYDVIAYSDNDPSLWGAERNQTRIVPPDELPGLVRASDAAVIIANYHYYLDIAKQLDAFGLSYYICRSHENLAYTLKDGILYPASLSRPKAYRKPDGNPYSVLFVQNKPCARTNKLAEALKNKGVFTYSAYTHLPSDMGERAFCREAPFWTFADLLRFVNESEFDVVHCSNTPDIFVNILIHGNKKVVHDCHDVVTLHKKTVFTEDEGLEFIANTQANGMIYTTEQMREVMVERYGVSRERTLVLGNYPLSAFAQVERLPKLSAADGQIHCVYEGGVVDKAGAKNMIQYFFEPFFTRLASLGVHVHIYSPRVPEYLKGLDKEYANIHYEGNYSGTELIRRMTQYDLGFACFPSAGFSYPEITSANKVYEYLAAGLPVVTNIKSYAAVMTANHCGGMLDMEHDDVPAKLRAYRQITIPADFCDTHGFTMDANAGRLLEFYKRI